jgi:hypothetical protein
MMYDPSDESFLVIVMTAKGVLGPIPAAYMYGKLLSLHLYLDNKFY